MARRNKQKAAGALHYSRLEDWADSMCLSLYPKHKDLSLARKVNLSVLTDVTAEHELLADLRVHLVSFHNNNGMIDGLTAIGCVALLQQKAQSAGLQALSNLLSEKLDQGAALLLPYYMEDSKCAAKIRTFCETTKHLLINLQIVC